MRQIHFIFPPLVALALGGSLSLGGCTPVRGRDSGDDDDSTTSVEALIGDWELRRFGSYIYPYESNEGGCTTITIAVLTAESDGDIEFLIEASDSGSCPDESYPPLIYDGSWDALGVGAWRIDIPDYLGVLTCGRDESQLECQDEVGGVIEFERL